MQSSIFSQQLAICNVFGTLLFCISNLPACRQGRIVIWNLSFGIFPKHIILFDKR
jgi:hypothetical protein